MDSNTDTSATKEFFVCKLCPTQIFMQPLIKMMVMMLLMMTMISHICCWYSLPSLSTVSVSVVSSAVPSVVDGLGCERNLEEKLSFTISEGKFEETVLMDTAGLKGLRSCSKDGNQRINVYSPFFGYVIQLISKQLKLLVH